MYVRAGRLRCTGESDGLTKAVAEECTPWSSNCTRAAGTSTPYEAEPAPHHRSKCRSTPRARERPPHSWPDSPPKTWLSTTFDHIIMDPVEDETIAERVVRLLGPESRCWSNQDDGCVDGVTGCTFDGLVVGSDGDRFAVLIQVADD